MEDRLAALRAVEDQCRLVLSELRDADVPPERREFVLRLVTEAHACLDELVSISDTLEEVLNPKSRD